MHGHNDNARRAAVVSVPWEVGGYTPIGRSSERESGGYAGVGILSL